MGKDHKVAKDVATPAGPKNYLFDRDPEFRRAFGLRDVADSGAKGTRKTRIVLGSVHGVNDADAKTVDFPPSLYELEVLAKHYAGILDSIHWMWDVLQQTGSWEIRMEPFAEMRIGQIADFLGEQRIREIIDNTGKLKDPIPRVWVSEDSLRTYLKYADRFGLTLGEVLRDFIRDPSKESLGLSEENIRQEEKDAASRGQTLREALQHEVDTFPRKLLEARAPNQDGQRSGV